MILYRIYRRDTKIAARSDSRRRRWPTIPGTPTILLPRKIAEARELGSLPIAWRAAGLS